MNFKKIIKTYFIISYKKIFNKTQAISFSQKLKKKEKKKKLQNLNFLNQTGLIKTDNERFNIKKKKKIKNRIFFFKQ